MRTTMFRRVRRGAIRSWLLCGCVGVLAAASASATRAEPSVAPTGVTRYDPGRAYNGYVLFAGADNKTHLIDMNGNEVHRWDHDGFPSVLLDPSLAGGRRGHVLVQLAEISGNATSAIPGVPLPIKNKTVGELDWDGKVVWEWGEHAPGGAAKQHHDLRRLANGDTLVLANLIHPVAGFAAPQVLDDVIYAVSPAGAVAWRWVASDHVRELGFTGRELQLIHNAPTPDYFHLNDAAPLGANRWFRDGDARFAPDNVIISSRNANFIAIIDRKTGTIVWHLGPHYPPLKEFKPQVPGPVDQISGQHDAHLIADGLPGAGDLLVFDNQGEAGYPPAAVGLTSGSRVLEIDPVKGRIVWDYTGAASGRPGWTFYSSFISSARRLPNGNTLIDEGMNGRFFQVTPKGDIVWEYVSPYFGKAPVGGPNAISNWVYRAQPVPYDWVPAGTPRSEKPVVPPDAARFHVSAAD